DGRPRPRCAPPSLRRQAGDRRHREGAARRREPALATRDRDERRDPGAGEPALERVRFLSLALGKVGHVLDAIKFEHTVFALPFPYIATVLAAGGWPGWWPVLWITAAMAGGRTCALASNRVIDRLIDARNPRTAGRHLPRGVLRAWELKALAVAGALLMV